MSATLMKCGCRAQGEINGKPACIVHFDMPGGLEIAPPPDLTGRKAVCTYCRRSEDSSLDLPFFVYEKEKSTDTFYNGCRGWD